MNDVTMSNKNLACELKEVGLANHKSATTLQRYARGARNRARAAECRGKSCAICLNDAGWGWSKTPCDHWFHQKCLAQHLKYNRERKCPLCRTHVPNRPRRGPSNADPREFERWLSGRENAEFEYLTVEELDLPVMQDHDVSAVVFIMRHNRQMFDLNMSTGEISDNGAVQIALALRGNETLLSLRLDNHMIGDRGAAALANALRVNATLQELHLDNNLIGDDGAVALAEALMHNTTLTNLTLDEPDTVHGREALALANGSRTTLNISLSARSNSNSYRSGTNSNYSSNSN